MTRFLAGAVLGLALAILGGPSLPDCHEDEVLIGTGDFDGARWTAYVCGPAVDDFTGRGAGGTW